MNNTHRNGQPGSRISALIEAGQRTHQQNLLMLAEVKNLPDFLELTDIATLLHKDPIAFKFFIKDQPVSITTNEA